jgi:hypothetical protein
MELNGAGYKILDQPLKCESRFEIEPLSRGGWEQFEFAEERLSYVFRFWNPYVPPGWRLAQSTWYLRSFESILMV